MLISLLGLVLPIGLSGAAEPRGPSPVDLARRAAAGDAGAPTAVEAAIESFFLRKDLWSLDAVAGGREALRLLGTEGSRGSVLWLDPSAGPEPLRLLTIDFGPLLQASEGSASGYVAYAIVQKGPGGQASVSWYHDLGRKISEQGGGAWHPLGGTLLGQAGSVGGRTLVIEEGDSTAGPTVGLLVLQERDGGWTATGRLAPPGGGRLLGVGDQGAVFVTRRDPPKGVLSGAPPELFRALVWYERTGGTFAPQPVEAPVPEPVTAAERLIAAIRKGEKDEARRLCVSPDVLESMLYFSPEWKGGGRIVKADATSVEFIYEERERPTLRIELSFENRAGRLLLTSATGRSEKVGP